MNKAANSETAQQARLILAPMEGVINARMRAMMTAIGGLDRCVTEFVRVTNQLLPPRVFYRLCPELAQGSLTPSGVPVHLQLLGSNPEMMAKNAQRAVELGAIGIDINFGCPAKTVNRHRGGSVLLQEPNLVGDIIAAVRETLPERVPVSAKIRLGYDDCSPLSAVAAAVEAAGADELCIHARTKRDGYKPPAHWHQIAPLHQAIDTPLIANGEIWNVEDWRSAREASGCKDIMLGRGALARPDLALAIRAALTQSEYQALPWLHIVDMLEEMLAHTRIECAPKHVGGPIKQWLGYLRRHYREAEALFMDIKRLSDADALAAAIHTHRKALTAS